jgi:dTDP-4-amino-4,6-dideoxygalactose transaminase
MAPRAHGSAGASTEVAPPVPFYNLSLLHETLRDDFGRSFDAVLTESAFIGGPFVDRFESEWSNFCGVDYAVGVANGTDAIELTLRALGVGAGDEVIVPANTFVASAAAVVAAGATPVFVDVDPGTLLVGADQVTTGLSSRTAAVLVVHLYGMPVNVREIEAVTQPLGIPIVEDAAQAHGARLGGRMAGSLGVAGTFSFYPGKNLGALGDGGAVTTNDPVLAERIRVLANHGRGRHHHHHVEVGRNSRLDSLQATFLSDKLPHLETQNEDRRRIVDLYRSELVALPIDFIDNPRGAVSANHLLVVQISDRDQFRDALDAAGIGTAIHYPTPCHRQPAFEKFSPGYLPVVERAADRIVSLPLFPQLTDDQVGRACNVITEVLIRGEER